MSPMTNTTYTATWLAVLALGGIAYVVLGLCFKFRKGKR